jgi:quinol monooxygenase YgiN
MFGTVARVKVKPGMEDQFVELGKSRSGQNGEIAGEVGYIVFKLENSPGEYIIAVAFEDRDSYFANAKRPETHQEFLEMRELLVEDPQWNDGEIVDMQGLGGI